jgi:phage/plasmid-like protein (TIGR03299 family)
MPAEVETMMYSEQVPWHGLGTYVGENPVLAEEAIVAAGLDWQVEKCPAFAAVTIGTEEKEVIADDHFLNVRLSDCKVLGSVQKRYQILQNREAFEFMDSLAGPKNLVQYHTAGALHGGRHIWLLATVTGLTIEPVPGDVTEPYILLVNGHDGRMALKALFTSVRVVCQNTLNLALGSAKKGITIRHTGDMKSKVEEAKKILGFAKKEVDSYSQVAKELSRKKMGDKVFEDFLDQLVPLPKEEEKRGKKLAVREKMTELFLSGPGTEIPGVKGTAWGALQAVTDFTGHHRTTRGAGKDADKLREKRLESVWFGSGNTMNQDALRMLVAM